MEQRRRYRGISPIFGTRQNRLLGLLGLVALVITLFAGALLAVGYPQPRLTGTSLGKEEAPDFRLRDSGGQAYALDQFRGKVIVLTFLYTHCPDACPLTAELLRHADEAAGHRKDVVYVAVSVDPAGDTPESITTFSEEHHLNELGDRWHYLVGSLPELQGVWRNYFIFAPTEGGGAGHSTAIYFIDKHGNRRVLTEPDVSAEDLARNEIILAKQ